MAANRTSEWSWRRWAGYGAAVAAFSFAVVSVYWGLGGVWGIDTLGGDLATRARARDPVVLGLNGAAAVLKVAGGILALALVQSWGRRLPDRPLIMTARAGAVLLITYGTVQTAGVLLVRLGVVRLADPVEPDVILWRLLLWEPWFLVGGSSSGPRSGRGRLLNNT